MAEIEKRDPLQDLKSLLVDGSICKDITYEGHVYTFKSLNEEEECWKDRYVQIDSPLAMASTKRAPILSIALRALDKVPVDQLFTDLVVLDEEDKKFLIAHKLFIETFSKMKREHINNLYSEYVRVIEKPVKKSIEEIKK